QAQLIIGDNQQGIKTVAGNANSIGYVSIGTAEFEARNGSSIKLLRLGNSEASVANIRNKTFPLSRTLHLVTVEVPHDLKKEFIDYCSSSQVHSLIEAHYFVPIQK
ncbi:MAG: phosphate ABC transporter substrate-binding protein, partial [Planctomycetota bacterium]